MSIRDNLVFPIISGIVVGIVVFFATKFYDEKIKYVEYISYNSINNLLKSYFVDTELVDENILELENTSAQCEVIANEMLDYQKTIKSLNQETKDLSEELKDLKKENGDMSSKISSQATVEFINPELFIKGEAVDTTLNDYIAVINGKNYYQETLLNTYILDKRLVVEGEKLTYDANAPERIKVVTNTVMHDIKGINVVKETSNATMGTKMCTYGFVSDADYRSGCLYIECGGQYSKLQFGLGHINDTGASNDKTLNIYYLNSDEEYACTYTKKLSEDMGYSDQITVQIFNTQTVKIEILEDFSDGEYGITDVYLIK